MTITIELPVPAIKSGIAKIPLIDCDILRDITENPGPTDEQREQEPVYVDVISNNFNRGDHSATAIIRCPLNESVEMRQDEYGKPRFSYIGDKKITTIVYQTRPEFDNERGTVDAVITARNWITDQTSTETLTSSYLEPVNFSSTESSLYCRTFKDNYNNLITNTYLNGRETRYTTTSNDSTHYTNNSITQSGYRTVFHEWTSLTDRHVNYWTGRDGSEFCVPEIAPGSRLREIIRSRMGPAIHSRQRGLKPPTTEPEARARQTLKRIIGETAFRKYISKGFVVIHGASGRTYQVFPGHKMTKVWENGEHVETLCIVLKGGFPDTDAVIMRILLIEDSEKEFKEKSNVFAASPSYAPSSRREIFVPGIEDTHKASLSSIFKELKGSSNKLLLNKIA